ncbi:MAG: hypothetical protein ABIB46_06295 [bacterium]
MTKPIVKKLKTKIIIHGKNNNKVIIENIRKAGRIYGENSYAVDIYINKHKIHTSQLIFAKNIGDLRKYFKKAYPEKLIDILVHTTL